MNEFLWCVYSFGEGEIWVIFDVVYFFYKVNKKFKWWKVLFGFFVVVGF